MTVPAQAVPRVRAGRVSIVFLSMLQLIGGGAAFVTWSLLSHHSSTADFGTASRAVAWGMASYLPLTFGLPFLLANFNRFPDDEVARGRILWSLRLVIWACCIAIGVGLALAVAQTISGFGSPAVPVALTLAGYAGLATTCSNRPASISRLGGWWWRSLSTWSYRSHG